MENAELLKRIKTHAYRRRTQRTKNAMVRETVLSPVNCATASDVISLLRTQNQKKEMLTDSKSLALYQVSQKSTIQTRPEYGGHSTVLETCE